MNILKSSLLLFFVPESANGGNMTSERGGSSGEAKAWCSRSPATRRCRKEVVAYFLGVLLLSTLWTVPVNGRVGWSRCLVDHSERPGAPPDRHSLSLVCHYHGLSLRLPWRQTWACSGQKNTLNQQRSLLGGGGSCTLLSRPPLAPPQSWPKLFSSISATKIMIIFECKSSKFYSFNDEFK